MALPASGVHGDTNYLSEQASLWKEFGTGATRAIPPLSYQCPQMPTHTWVEVPSAFALDYTLAGDARFEAILDFPSGIDRDGRYTVSVDGSVLGEFGPGESVVFSDFVGSDVRSFRLEGIEPVSGPAPSEFPLKLSFDTPTADLLVRPMEAPSLKACSADPSRFVFTWHADERLQYELEASTDLLDWDGNFAPFLETNGFLVVTNTSDTFQKFFRVGMHIR